MGSLIYAPQVTIYIRTASGITYDVSDDVTAGQVTRRSDGVSTAQFTLQNARRKYDGVFTPNDRVIILMKRLAWVRVFTGYLNKVPLLSIWPTVVNLTASCTLKRAQYWFWNPMTQATQTMISNAFSAASGDASTSDGGAGAAALAILNNVMGWPPSKAHIGAIPTRWLDIAYKIAQQVQSSEGASDRLAAQFYSNLTAGGIVGGVPNGPAIRGVLKGSYGPFSGQQLRNAETIYSVGVSKGASLDDITVALMVSMAGASLNNAILPNPQGYMGLFHQKPADGWGTFEQLLNPTYAASAFFDKLLAVGTRSSLTPAAQAQMVSKIPNVFNYASFESYANQMVSDISKAQTSNVPSAATNPLPQGFDPNSRPTGTSTGADFATTAVNFVQQYPTIPYTEDFGGTQMNIISASPPPGLDCSSFVQAAFLRTLGALYDCPRVASDQSAWCTQMLTAAQGLATPGALMFKGPGKGIASHVEISLGDGHHTVGSHHSGTYASIGGDGAGYWDYAGLPPRMTFSIAGGAPTALQLAGAAAGSSGGSSALSSAATAAAAGSAGLRAAPNPTPYSTTPGYNPNDRFDSLFGDKAWVAVSSYDATNPDYILANSLSGARALLDDQPLLPYLKQLFGASMRSFSSAPNGDLIAWFPDYYGLWGTAPVMTIEAIECKSFAVDWSDDYLVTHQFTASTPGVGAGTNTFDPATGSLTGTGIDPSVLVFNSSVASIDIPAVMYALFGLEATEADAANFASFIYRRFGARPDYQAVPGLVGPAAGFFAALYLFMRQWAFQYSATMPLTWMPEVWPGMLLQAPWADFQCYVNAVTHTWQFGENGFFNTDVNIAAPARMPKADNPNGHVLLGLPLAGGLAQPATPSPIPSNGPRGRMFTNLD